MYSCASLAEARGCPIRIFTDQSLFAAPRNFSQRTTSFIASQCQGIHQMLLSRLMLSLPLPIFFGRQLPLTSGVGRQLAPTSCVQPRQIERTDNRSKKDLYVLDLPAAERSSAAAYICRPQAFRRGQRKLASKSLHSRCQSARRQPETRAAKLVIRGLDGQIPECNTELEWWSQTGSNRRPEACKATALPTELWPPSHSHDSPNMIRSDHRDLLQSGGPGKTRTSDLTLIKRAL